MSTIDERDGVILLVDAGNSRIKWGVREGGVWLQRGVCATAASVGLATAWQQYPITHALISCVAAEAVRADLAQALPDHLVEVRWLRAAHEAHALTSAYQPPDALGPDRYAALVAARHRGLGACLVVSAGTALTVDALTASGQFVGGCIAPGQDLMRDALFQGTAGVRGLGEVVAGFPTNTADAVATGLALAAVGVVSAMRERLQRLTGSEVTVLLTGGARGQLRDRLPEPVLECDDLVLEGLVWMTKDWRWEKA